MTPAIRIGTNSEYWIMEDEEEKTDRIELPLPANDQRYQRAVSDTEYRIREELAAWFEKQHVMFRPEDAAAVCRCRGKR